MIRTYQPKIQVTLVKTVDQRSGTSERVRDAGWRIDLTRYLGDHGKVNVYRAINSADNHFSLQLVDRMHPEARDSLYGLIAPMDMVEIRMAREPRGGDNMPVVMRGFVDTVRRKEAVGQDGNPIRTIIVHGGDYGLIMKAVQIFYAKEYPAGVIALEKFKFFYQYGADFKLMSAEEFAGNVLSVVNDWLKELDAQSSKSIIPQLTLVSSVKNGRIGPFGVSPYEGDMWNFLSNWSDLTWNELIFNDTEFGPELIYRPNPYHDLNGDLIMPDAVEPDRIKITDSHIRSIEIGRGLYRVGNFYQVDAPNSYVINRNLLNTYALDRGILFDDKNPNSDPTLFGLRKIAAQSNQTSDLSARRADNLTETEKEKFASDWSEWVEQRRDELIKMNKDNSVLEDGSMVLMGNENIKPGVYLELSRGALVSEYYVHDVLHEFSPLSGFVSTVNVLRGTGFVSRRRLQSSPYLTERRSGVYG